MATMSYCLKHGNYQIVYTDPDRVFHLDWENENLCEGPFYTSAPPELQEDWFVLPEPSDEELEEMDKNVELLLWDLGLMEKQ